jgi:DNA polymerase III delta subunit
MTDDNFYHKNIFDEVVDADFTAPDEEYAPLIKKQNNFPIFSLTDAVGARNKKEAWIQYERALASGMAPEEVFWKVVWQIKNMLLASRTTEKGSGLNPFVYKKAKASLKNFKEKELENLSEQLVVGYHQARRGEGDIETFLEKFLLSL